MNFLRDAAVIDLFCGVGGLTHGFVKEGFRVLAGFDVDASCRYAYEYNNATRFILEDVNQIQGEQLRKIFGNAQTKILIGCAPCQPFSSYNSGDRKKDGKWRLLYSFSRLIQETSPDIISMENVPSLKKFDHGQVLKDFMDLLCEQGYCVKVYEAVPCAAYGVPQLRTRLILLASRYEGLSLIPPIYDIAHYRTVRDTIAELPPLKAGEISKTDPLHRSAKLSALNLARIRHSHPGKTWRDWPITLRANCHCKKSGSTFPSVYGRMGWDTPAPTMTTLCYGYGNGRFGHPEQDRAISLREAALFQTFPLEYEFVEPGEKYRIKTIARQIGNAVPVKLGQAIAQSIKRHLLEVDSRKNDRSAKIRA